MQQTLLVVGTTAITEQLFKLALMDSKFTLLASQSTEDALEEISKSKPSIIFVDKAIAQEQVSKFIQKVKLQHNTPIILLKGSQDQLNQNYLSAIGANESFTRPFEPNELMSLLNNYKNENKEPINKKVIKSNPNKKQISAISLLKKAELENAKSFIKSNLAKKATNQTSKTVIKRSDISDILNSEEYINEKLNPIAKEVIERVAWEVVPKLAEELIRRELKRLTEE